MRFFLSIVFFACIAIGANAQQNTETGGLLEKATQLVANNPQQAIKIGAHLLTTSVKNSDKAAANLVIADSYLTMGQYNQALVYAFRSRSFSRAANRFDLELETDLFIAGILRFLQLDRPSENYLAQVETLNGKSAVKVKPLINGRILYEKALGQLGKRKASKAIRLLQQAKSLSGNDIDFKNQLDATTGKTYAFLGDFKNAEICFSRSFHIFKKHQNLALKTRLLTETARMYFQQKQYQRAIDTLFTALKPAVNLQNIFLQMDINKQLALNFLALNNRKQYHFYNLKFLALSDTEETLENESTNTAFNLISKEQENNAAAEEKKYAFYFYSAAGFFIALLGLGIVLYLKNKSREKRYREIAAYLKNSKPVFEEPAKKEGAKNLSIPAETEQALLSKLRKFENSVKFTNRDMSLALLSAQMETNTKYLSEIINRHRQDNFNTYINKLRIAYIMEKMKSNPEYLNYKISYLAEESGFSSHSSFATVFKSITGIAPTTFIDFLKNEEKLKKEK